MIQQLLCKIIVIALFLSCHYSFATSDYEVFLTVDKNTPPGNIAVTQNDRVFMSTHHFFGAEYKVVEISASGKAKPFPNADFSRALNPVLGIIADNEGILWILETATGTERAGRLIAWDLQENQLHKIIYLAPPVIPANSFLNDMAVDTTHNAIYITDTAGGANSALIVVDLNTGEARRVLEASFFTQPENIDMLIDNKTVTLGGQAARIGANPITIDHKHQWVYFAPMSGTALYRVKTGALLNKNLSAQQLLKSVERYADKPISDGITIDNGGNIYITDITQNAIGYIDRQRNYNTLFQDKELFSWADGFANSKDQEIYVTVNKLHKSPVLNDGQDASANQYYIIKFKALSPTTVGR